MSNVMNPKTTIIKAGSVSAEDIQQYKNHVVNGDFKIWQRGDSITVPYPFVVQTADGWESRNNSGSWTGTVSRKTLTSNVLDQSPASCCNCIFSVGVAFAYTTPLKTYLHDIRNFANKKMTLSFYCRANVLTNISILTLYINQTFGPGGSNSVGILAQPLLSSLQVGEWIKFVYTLDFPSIDAKTFNDFLQSGVEIYFYIGSSTNASTIDFDIAQVSLIDGEHPNPIIEDRTASQEIALLQDLRTNHIINGDMGLWQRGDSFSCPPGTTYTADRFSWYGVTLDCPQVNCDKSTDVPTEEESKHLFDYSLYTTVTFTGPYTLSASLGVLSQKIEGGFISGLSNKTFTLSFWVKSNMTGVFSIAFQTISSPTYTFPTTYTVVSSNTWERKNITLQLNPANLDGLIGIDGGLSIMFVYGAGSDYQTSSPNTWNNDDNCYVSGSNLFGTSAGHQIKFTGIELYEGYPRNYFKTRDVATELALCQRYCQVFGGNNADEYFAIGVMASYTVVNFIIPLIVKMRVDPVLTYSIFLISRIQYRNLVGEIAPALCLQYCQIIQQRILSYYSIPRAIVLL